MKHWVYGGFLAAFVILALIALFRASMPLALLLIVLQLPIYMIHQFEEHDDDRFRRYVNLHVGGGDEVLSVPAVFVINIGGVWLLNLASIWLAATVDLGFGLIGIYGAFVNSLVHIVAAILSRNYNPGLMTAISLLLPSGTAGIWAVAAAGHGGWPFEALGLGTAILLHLAIIGHVRLQKHQRRPVGPG